MNTGSVASSLNLCSDGESNESEDLPKIEIKKSVNGNKGELVKSTQTSEQKMKKKATDDVPIKMSSQEMIKMYKQTECTKYMAVEISPTLSKLWYAADISREVSAVGAQLEIAADICDPCLVMWLRRLPQQFTSNDGQVELSPKRERCDQALYILPAEEVAELVGPTLATRVSGIKDMVGCKLTLMVFGVKEYLSKSKRGTRNSNRKSMTEIDLDMSITDVLVSADCDTIIANTPNELALHIVHFTRAIANAPRKLSTRDCENLVDFYMPGEKKNSVAVDKDGNGVERVWQQMLAVLPLSSLETSRAICAKYKTPRAFIEAATSEDIKSEIANIEVSRSAVPGSKRRRLGPEFARKLYTLFTSADGDAPVE